MLEHVRSDLKTSRGQIVASAHSSWCGHSTLAATNAPPFLFSPWPWIGVTLVSLVAAVILRRRRPRRGGSNIDPKNDDSAPG